MPDFKFIGHNYQTPDIVAKVMGRAKYAEDFRAEGMLFCKLLLSPEPHAQSPPYRRAGGAQDERRRRPS